MNKKLVKISDHYYLLSDEIADKDEYALTSNGIPRRVDAAGIFHWRDGCNAILGSTERLGNLPILFKDRIDKMLNDGAAACRYHIIDVLEDLKRELHAKGEIKAFDIVYDKITSLKEKTEWNVEAELRYIHDECHNYDGAHIGKDCSCKSGDIRSVHAYYITKIEK